MVPSEPLAFLFVDGYNVIGATTQWSTIRDQEGLGLARHQLIEALTNYAAYQSFETRLVFDAYGQADPARIEPVTQHLSIHYTAQGETADSYIERWCSRLRHDPKRRIVATSDRAQQLTVMGYGAEWMSAQQLAAEVVAITQQERCSRERQRRSRTPRGSLAHSLSPEAQAKLRQLRLGHS